MYDRILLSTDGTVASDEANSHAVALAAVGTATKEAGVDVVTEIRHGRPAETITRYATGEDVDLIVLGTKRRPEEYRALLGSVTDRVLRVTSRPATVLKTEVTE